jgi:hypothetical protein
VGKETFAWQAARQGGPTATPIVETDKVYSLSPNGHVHCLGAVKGKLLWEKRPDKEYRIQELMCRASPLIEGRRKCCRLRTVILAPAVCSTASPLYEGTVRSSRDSIPSRRAGKAGGAFLEVGRVNQVQMRRRTAISIFRTSYGTTKNTEERDREIVSEEVQKVYCAAR